MPNLPGLVQIVTVLAAIVLVTRPLGGYMRRVFDGERTFLSPVMRPVERGIYRVMGVDETAEQRWTGYAVSILVFAFIGILVLYVQQRIQDSLPLNPNGLGAVPQDLSFNTAVSFETNTNWQNYSGENTLSYLTQMAGLSVRNFTSAAMGLVVAIALARGLVRRSASTIGNFWVDVTRSTLYILLPIAFVAALVLVSQGVVQTFNASTTVHTLQGASQTITVGPVASQEVIKNLGNNGGGFFNANAAHPFENPNGLTNWVEMFLILLIPFALTNTFGRMTGNEKQGWALFAAMMVILVVAIGVVTWSEQQGNPLYPQAVNTALGNMEGKEVRFGADASALFAAVTTGTSTGAVNSMHDSFLPLGGMVPMVLMQLGEITPGGIGAGFYGHVVFGAILAIFIAGLMVGRTPEYLGKKIESYEIKMAMLAVLAMGASTLVFTAIASVAPPGLAGPLNAGPHGFSEILYAYSSQTGNNGSAFAGLSGNTLFYNLTGAFAMLIGRFAEIIPALAIAGSMASKRRVAPSLGTFPTTGPIWVALLIGVIVIVGALTFFPALSLGPIVEQLKMAAGQVF
jgi:K+-transporting ATPase ATPase A chain